ncbi:uncharacterized protein IUM83_11068 [Phytophthora cinnamomi]|uniref:uncharacterized protein n=1 Tax=Phytophthora cinnamomi TaxID=4785 RepID=UPI003559B873|nr:hypothetical protein IUM83_11068 [Phytophthora cinnamomi]
MPRRAGRRPRHAPPSELLLPPLRNPARCGNQREADADTTQWDGRHRRRRPREPQVAFVYLPPVFPTDTGRRRRHRSSSKCRATKPLRCSSSSGDEEYDSSGSDSDGSASSVEIERPARAASMRSQRMRSIAAMSKLQHAAAATIQREYRFFRRRRAGRHRRNLRLARQAQDLLDVFLLQEVTSIVPTCLLDVLRETRLQEATTTKRREDLAASLAGGVLASLVDECIRDVFHDVLQAMVKSYFTQQIDLSRAATPPALAVAADVLDDWTKELAADLLPEVLAELASEYTARQQLDVVWESLLHDQLQTTASDAIVAVTLDSVTTSIASPSTNDL